MYYRDAAANCAKTLTEILGSEWAEQELLPRIAVLRNNPNYLHRQTLVFALTVVFYFITT